jgi:hypothetical protein
MIACNRSLRRRRCVVQRFIRKAIHADIARKIVNLAETRIGVQPSQDVALSGMSSDFQMARRLSPSLRRWAISKASSVEYELSLPRRRGVLGGVLWMLLFVISVQSGHWTRSGRGGALLELARSPCALASAARLTFRIGS